VRKRTPFQEAVVRSFKTNEWYTERSQLVIEQAVIAAIHHEKPTNLIITGLGQGVWKGGFGEKTRPAFTEALCATLRRIRYKNNLHHLTVFGYVDSVDDDKVEGQIRNAIASGPIANQDFRFTYERDFTAPVFGQQAGLVDMFSFAWDGMSYVGNEYFQGAGDVSADPAAAYSTSVAFLAHPKINPDMYTRFPYYHQLREGRYRYDNFDGV
jgi:hypothetical protein